MSTEDEASTLPTTRTCTGIGFSMAEPVVTMMAAAAPRPRPAAPAAGRAAPAAGAASPAASPEHADRTTTANTAAHSRVKRDRGALTGRASGIGISCDEWPRGETRRPSLDVTPIPPNRDGSLPVSNCLLQE